MFNLVYFPAWIQLALSGVQGLHPHGRKGRAPPPRGPPPRTNKPPPLPGKPPPEREAVYKIVSICMLGKGDERCSYRQQNYSG